jgi:predicted dienelactone hydrolase
MFKLLAIALVLMGMSGGSAHAADRVGFRQILVPDVAGERPLDVAVWYPTGDSGPPTTVGENPAFVGESVVKDAKAADGPHPLVLISHGYQGNWRNQQWLAGELARHGYVVAAPNHPGTSTFDRRPSEAAKLWQRPHDISRVIDALIADPALTGGIAASRIAAIGHSLGGWTVIEIAGGRFEADRLRADCKAQAALSACTVFAAIGAGGDALAAAALGGDLKDDRVGAVVALDLGLARGFAPASLTAIRVPVLVFAAGVDVVKVPAKLESGYLIGHLPVATSHYIEVADAAHFSFMQLCKPGAAALIEEDTPGDSIVCKDGGKRDRAAIHRQVADQIIAFLARALPPR